MTLVPNGPESSSRALNSINDKDCGGIVVVNWTGRRKTLSLVLIICLVLVQPRKTFNCVNMNENCILGCKALMPANSIDENLISQCLYFQIFRSLQGTSEVKPHFLRKASAATRRLSSLIKAIEELKKKEF